jgi:hypothetical protein
MSNWKVIRITLPPKYYRPGIYPAVERSVVNQLLQIGLEQALAHGVLQEIRPAAGSRPARRFMIYLSDARNGQDIPISFSLSLNGDVLQP